ncbi:MAG: 23S rRNA (guanosine(2251)-2'-O)-methyltransferase RlmB [Pseudomonadota bacterium]
MNKKKSVPRPGQKSVRNQYYLYGTHPVLAALHNPNRQILEISCSENVYEQYKDIIGKHKYQIVTNAKLSGMLKADATHQGIAALVKCIAENDLQAIDLSDPNTKIAILDQITDIHNIGAIMRSAAGFGIKAIIMTHDNSPEENGAMAKAASGALEIVPLVRVTNLRSTIDLLKKQGFWIAGLDGEATQSIDQANLSGKIALILGAEGKGMRRLTLESCDMILSIPIQKSMESLNVSSAAAIVFYAATIASTIGPKHTQK